MKLKSTPEALTYQQLVETADYLHGVDFELFQLAELNAANFAADHEKEIWDESGEHSPTIQGLA